MASFGVAGIPLAISHSAAAMKSSKTFCFLSLVPAWCHSSPYSPPPRKLGRAYRPPISIQASTDGLKLGVSAMLNPPYP